MESKKAIVIFRILSRKFEADLEIPLDISANELVFSLNAAYNLDIDVLDVKNCYLRAENPITLLKGNKLLVDFGIHNGTILYTA